MALGKTEFIKSFDHATASANRGCKIRILSGLNYYRYTTDIPRQILSNRGVSMLSTDQKIFFARNGYVQISSAVPASICEYLVEQSWSHLPSYWDRADASSWEGTVTDSCHTSELPIRRGLLKFQKGALLKDATVISAFGPRSLAGRIAGDLLGCEVGARYRGLYMIVPFAEAQHLARVPRPHVEAHPVQIVCTGYLRDVPPGKGGTFVWPGSHFDIYPCFNSKIDFLARPTYADVLAKYKSLQPVELSGKAGDIILMHHRLLHAPSLNHGSDIRFAMFTDYMSTSIDTLSADAPGHNPWEDWPGMDDVGCFATQIDHSYDRIDRSIEQVAAEPDNHTSLNKREASRLVRSFSDGELWLILSTSDALAATRRIEPCGDLNLSAAGLRVYVNGHNISSRSTNDFVSPVALGRFQRIVASGLDRPLHLRLIHVRRPFHHSPIVAETILEPNTPLTLDMAAAIMSYGGAG